LIDTRDESNPDHSHEFYNREDQLTTATWKPEHPGVAHYDNQSRRVKRSKPKKIDPDECRYHSCKAKGEFKNALLVVVNTVQFMSNLLSQETLSKKV